MIGGADHDVSAPSGGAISSYALGYSSSSGYSVSTVLHPGQGYWLRVSADTVLTLGPTAVAKASSLSLDSYTKFTFRDKLGRGQTLYFIDDRQSGVECDRYSLPPVAPSGIFDVRYGSGRFAEAVPSTGIPDEGLRIPISVQSAVYPVTVTYRISRGGEYQIAFEERNAGEETNISRMSGEGQLQLDGSATGQLFLTVSAGTDQLPRVFALRQNYPNPFNPTTRIEYDLPQAAHVTLRVFDIAGREVKVLVDNDQPAGSRWVAFDGSSLSSGMYICKMNAGKFSATKKILLVK